MKYQKKPVSIDAAQWFKVGDHPSVERFTSEDPRGWVEARGGGHIVDPGDWIVTELSGEVYPVKPQRFSDLYEPSAAREYSNGTDFDKSNVVNPKGMFSDE